MDQFLNLVLTFPMWKIGMITNLLHIAVTTEQVSTLEVQLDPWTTGVGAPTPYSKPTCTLWLLKNLAVPQNSWGTGSSHHPRTHTHTDTKILNVQVSYVKWHRSMQSALCIQTPNRKSRRVEVFTEKDPRISRPAQFKSKLFKGQLYLGHCPAVSTWCLSGSTRILRNCCPSSKNEVSIVHKVNHKTKDKFKYSVSLNINYPLKLIIKQR